MRKRTNQPVGRPQRERKCELCGEVHGARAMREHRRQVHRVPRGRPRGSKSFSGV